MTMKNNTIKIALAVFMLLSAGATVNAKQADSALQIYLTRETAIKDNIPALGQVAIIRGQEDIVAKASKVTLGRISAPGQKIIIDRSIVLSRLASNGIPASSVAFTGAEKITVTQQCQIIKGDEFVERALAFLQKNSPNDSICQWNLIRLSKDLVLSGDSNEIKYSVSLVKTGIKNQAKVSITVFSNDKEIATRDIAFRLKYNCRKLVARVDIPAGAVIRPENIKIEKTVSNTPEPANWSVPYGFVAKRRLAANSVIKSTMIAPAKPIVLIKRNQTVLIKVDRRGLFITAIGKAMQDGRLGEYIKVQNVDSRQIIMAKVNEDRSVEPVF